MNWFWYIYLVSLTVYLLRLVSNWSELKEQMLEHFPEHVLWQSIAFTCLPVVCTGIVLFDIYYFLTGPNENE